MPLDPRSLPSIKAGKAIQMKDFEKASEKLVSNIDKMNVDISKKIKDGIALSSEEKRYLKKRNSDIKKRDRDTDKVEKRKVAKSYKDRLKQFESEKELLETQISADRERYADMNEEERGLFKERLELLREYQSIEDGQQKKLQKLKDRVSNKMDQASDFIWEMIGRSGPIGYFAKGVKTVLGGAFNLLFGSKEERRADKEKKLNMGEYAKKGLSGKFEKLGGGNIRKKAQEEFQVARMNNRRLKNAPQPVHDSKTYNALNSIYRFETVTMPQLEKEAMEAENDHFVEQMKIDTETNEHLKRLEQAKDAGTGGEKKKKEGALGGSTTMILLAIIGITTAIAALHAWFNKNLAPVFVKINKAFEDIAKFIGRDKNEYKPEMGRASNPISDIGAAVTRADIEDKMKRLRDLGKTQTSEYKELEESLEKQYGNEFANKMQTRFAILSSSDNKFTLEEQEKFNKELNDRLSKDSKTSEDFRKMMIQKESELKSRNISGDELNKQLVEYEKQLRDKYMTMFKALMEEKSGNGKFNVQKQDKTYVEVQGVKNLDSIIPNAYAITPRR